MQKQHWLAVFGAAHENLCLKPCGANPFHLDTRQMADRVIHRSIAVTARVANLSLSTLPEGPIGNSFVTTILVGH